MQGLANKRASVPGRVVNRQTKSRTGRLLWEIHVVLTASFGEPTVLNKQAPALYFSYCSQLVGCVFKTVCSYPDLLFLLLCQVVTGTLLFLLLPGIRLRRIFIFIVRCVLYVCTIAVVVPVFENPLKTMAYDFLPGFVTHCSTKVLPDAGCLVTVSVSWVTACNTFGCNGFF